MFEIYNVYCFRLSYPSFVMWIVRIYIRIFIASVPVNHECFIVHIVHACRYIFVYFVIVG